MLTKENDDIARKAALENVSSWGKLSRAKLLFDAGDFGNALQSTDAILRSDSEHLGALEVKVRAQWRLGDFTAVIKSLLKLESLNPYEPGYFLMHGDALRLLGRHAEARSAYERCLGTDDRSTRLEAVAGIDEIDAQYGPPLDAGPVPMDGVTEFMPSPRETMDAWMLLDRAGTTDDAPAWAAARPS